MHLRSTVLAVTVGCFCAIGALAHDAAPQSARLVPLAPMSQDVEILFGDPEVAGQPFVMRIRELAGGAIPPHRHPVDEHITVVQGTLFFNIGEDCDRAKMRELKTGAYAFIPRGTTMCGYTPEAAVVQVHGVGPFHIHWRAGSEWRDGLATLDSANAAEIFRYRRGMRVLTPRGRGTIRQGYDSGEVIGYEIDGPDGTLFMALENEITLEPPQ